MRTLSTVIGIVHAHPAADDAAALEGAVVAFIANVNYCVWANERVAYYAFSIACLEIVAMIVY